MRTNNTLSAHPRRFGMNGLFRNRDCARRVQRSLALCLLGILIACAPGDGGDSAANGGMSGTGISQGSVTAFGSIFVNGVEWEIGEAVIDRDGVTVSEADLRLGMVVRVEGEFESGGTSGIATTVFIDYLLQGPIDNDPVDIIPGGLEKQFEILGTNVIIHELNTVFGGGAGFETLAADDVVQVSGFIDTSGSIQATRIEFEGQFPANLSAELHALVSGLITNPDGSGSFILGTTLVRFTTATTFDDVTPATLSNGDFVEVEGTLNLAGIELNASRIAREEQGLSGSAEDAEIEGFVTNFVSNTNFFVNGTQVDATNATLEPPGFVINNGSRVEVEGRLESGVLIADEVKSEDEDEDSRIEARVVSINPGARTLVILGVTVSADGRTRIEDDRDDDENFLFSEIQPGDWLKIRGRQTGPAAVLAERIERDEDEDDVILEGPVTSLDVDVNAPSISILNQAIPLDSGTVYFDANSNVRTEEQFFRTPGDVSLNEIVRASDKNAADLQVLGEADEVEIEGN